jgi:hypothetical protein
MRFPTTGYGKGCKPRPSTISREDYDLRWDYIYRDSRYKGMEFEDWKKAIKKIPRK